MNPQAIVRLTLTSLVLLLPGFAFAEPVARVDGREIARVELELALEPQLRELDARRARLLEAGLDELVAEALVAREAERVGLEVDVLLAERADYAPVTEADVEAWYRENAARLRRPLEAVREPARTHLETTRRREARDRLVDELRGRYAVERMLEPYRVELDHRDLATAEVAGRESVTLGRPDAAVEVTVFSDFECPYCRRLAPILEAVRAGREDDVRVVFRNLPLVAIHPRAEPAALAALCAAEQDRFWAFHDHVFAGDGLAASALEAAAEAAEVDLVAWNSCRESSAVRERLAIDLAAAAGLGVSSTPSVFVNGRPVAFVAGSDPAAVLAATVNDELARRGNGPSMAP